MSKPTLVQSLLNRPSQTYAPQGSQAPKKEYHSTRQEMLRIAAEANSQSQTTSRSASPAMSTPTSSVTKVNKGKPLPPRSPTSAPSPRSKSSRMPPKEPSYEDDDSVTTGDSDLEMYFTPNTSPRASMASSSTVTFPSKRRPNRRSLHSNTDSAPRSPGSSFQVFASPRNSGISTTFSDMTTTSANSNLNNRAAYTLSTASSLSSNSLDAHSVFSDLSGASGAPFGSDGSTLSTSPHQSDLDIARAKGLQHMTPGRAATTTTEMTTTTTIVPVSAYMHAAKGNTAHAAGFGTGAYIRSAPQGQQRSANDQWAKDVKWLVPNGTTSGQKPASKGIPSAVLNGKHAVSPPQAKLTAESVVKSNGVPSPKAFNAFAPLTTASAKPANTQTRTGQPSTSAVPPPTRKPVPSAAQTPPTKELPNGHANAPQGPSHNPADSRAKQPQSSSNRTPKTTPSRPESSSRSPSSAPQTTRNQSSSQTPSPAHTHQPSGSSSSRSTSPSSSTTQLSSTSSNQPSTTPSSSNAHPNPSRRNHSTAKVVHPSIMMNMSALMEEDEEGPFTPRMERKLELDLATDSESYSSRPQLRHTKERGRDKAQQRLSQNEDPQVMMRRRRSRSLDSHSDGTLSTRSGSPTSHARSTATLSTTGQGHKTPQTMTSEVQALSYSSGSLPSNGTQGYSSLVLPRAPAPLALNNHSTRSNGLFSLNLNLTKLSLSSDGKIDLTRSGVAQTTMASVEVVRGLSGTSGGILGVGEKGANGLSRSGSKVKSMFNALGRKNSNGSRSSPPGSGSSTPRRIREVVDGTPLGFTSYRSPPTHVPSRSVLVQVWAVGVDGVDGRLTGMRFGSGLGSPLVDLSREREEASESTLVGQTHSNGVVNGNAQAEESDTGYDTETTLKKTKNALAALGRSLSFSKKKKKSGSGSGESSNGGTQAQTKHKPRSASIQLSGPIPLQPHSSNHSQGSQQLNSPSQTQIHSSAVSLKRSNTTASYSSQVSNSTTGPYHPGISRSRSARRKIPKPHAPVVGFIPGRSFVGRVLECGWDVRDEVIRKGEWVVGLIDVRKCGALTEFIVVDRHRVHRVPHPRQALSLTDPDAPPTPIWVSPPKPKNHHHSQQQHQQYHHRHHPQYQHADEQQDDPESVQTLMLEELALLPLCGLPAYRAVRTFQYAFSSLPSGATSPRDTTEFDQTVTQTMSADNRRRALVLRGHDGAGAMAVQMLVRKGWRVSVHVPFSCIPINASQALADTFMRNVEDRAREWGADEVIFDDAEEGDIGDGDDGRSAAVRVIDTLREEGDVFDAILDTLGGKEVREAGERLLRANRNAPLSPTTPTAGNANKNKKEGFAQFTTLFGDVPERAIPSASDHFKANMRSLRLGLNDSSNGFSAPLASPGIDENGPPSATLDPKNQGRFGYAWVSVAHDVEEGEDVGETLGTVLRLALEDGIKPLVEDAAGGILGRQRVVPFEKTPYVFVEHGPLNDGGTVVVKIAS